MAPTADTEPNGHRTSDDAPEQTRSRLRDDDEDVSLAAATVTEGTPLLANDLPADILPDKGFRVRVIAMSITFLIILEFSAFIMEAPAQQLTEDVLCYHRYRDHILGTPDERCKNRDVQKDLTLYKSSLSFVSTLFPLLVQVPMGIVADHYGRRRVAFVGILGGAINVSFGMIALVWPDRLSIWASVPFAVTLLIGGGANTVTAMIWTILSDVIPVADRASIFYQLSAIMIIFSALFYPLSAWLMGITPWLPVGIGMVLLWVGVLLGLFIPETKDFRTAADKVQAQQDDGASDEEQEQSEAVGSNEDGDASPARPSVWKSSLAIAKHDAARIWRFVFGSPQIMMLIIAQAFMAPLGLAILIYGLQYMTRRFKWDWSTATYITTIPRIVAVVMLLLVLPLLSKLATDYLKMNPLKRDLQFARFSILVIALGNFFIGIASTPPLLIVGMVVEMLGMGYTSQLRALVTAVVEPHMMATVNTTISTMEAVLSLVGLPFVGWLVTAGLDIGEPWVGLPFLVLAGFSLCIAAILLVYRVPKELARVEGHT